MEYVLELVGDDIPDGVVEAIAGQHQSGAAGNAHHRHQHPLAVTEQIAHRDLMAEGKPPPDKGDLFQKDPFARRGRFGPHDGSRGLPQNAAAHRAGDQQNAQQRNDKAGCRDPPVERRDDGREIVHDAVGVINDGGEQLEADGEAQQTANYRGA